MSNFKVRATLDVIYGYEVIKVFRNQQIEYQTYTTLRDQFEKTIENLVRHLGFFLNHIYLMIKT